MLLLIIQVFSGGWKRRGRALLNIYELFLCLITACDVVAFTVPHRED